MHRRAVLCCAVLCCAACGVVWCGVVCVVLCGVVWRSVCGVPCVVWCAVPCAANGFPEASMEALRLSWGLLAADLVRRVEPDTASSILRETCVHRLPVSPVALL